MTYQLSLLLVAYRVIWALSQVIQNIRQIIMVRPFESCIRFFCTIVGERGLKLSGGEKERIAIARVLRKRPALYIFDEAISSLDLRTEETIMNNIAPLLKNSTSLIIAHRLSTVVNADEILVLYKEIVIERGAHLSLRAQGSHASLWRTQEEAYKKFYAA